MSPRVGASVPGRPEPSAAFRHSEPGLNGARGFPRGRGADVRAWWRCVVSARRVAGSAALPGSQPHPPGFKLSLLLRGCCGEGHPCAEPGAARPCWASLSTSSGLGEWLLESGGKAFLSSSGAWGGVRGHRAWGGVELGWAASEVSRRMERLSFVL